ncbi:MAG: hypothetical protein RBT70_01530 [Alphaproteobacteria bacterium]|jgi:hypothetical protein|nr:hypothetical protein [Alphaproteobacteria bacterium]
MTENERSSRSLARENRVAEALRANLKRRKTQQQARQEPDKAHASETKKES